MRLAVLPMWLVLFGVSPARADDQGLWIADNPQPSVRQLYDPCRDGRISDGEPHSCAEIRRRHMRERWGAWSEPDNRASVEACSDGRVSDGRPRTCRELLEWMEHR